MSALSILSAKNGRLITISPSTCFTDTGSTAATVGQQVASVSSNGAYFQWETQKPTLRGSGGVYWLEFPVDAYLFSGTPGVSAGADHARGAILSSSDTSVWPRFWRTTNTASGTNNSSISAIGYNQGKPFIFNRDDAGGNVVEAVHATQIGSGIVSVSAARRSGATILRVNGAQSASTTAALSGGYYPNRAVIGSPDAACNIYAVWDCPVNLTDAELLEIENDLGTQAGASWASAGGSGVTADASVTLGDVSLSADGSVTAAGGVNAAAAIQLGDVTLTAAGSVAGASGSITLPVALRKITNKAGGAHASATVTVLAIDRSTGQVAASYSLSTDASGNLTSYVLTGLVSGRDYALLPFVGTVASGAPGHAAALTAA